MHRSTPDCCICYPVKQPEAALLLVPAVPPSHLRVWLIFRCKGVSHHDSGDNGDEGIAVGQQSVGGLGAAVALSVGRTDALREGGGGRSVAPRPSLLHLLLDVVLYDVAVVVFPHRGANGGGYRGAGAAPETMEPADGAVCKQPSDS